ncbi:Metal cation efflux system protein CzcD [bacterium HR40]|nr:Metal cation efflux system protein CzcD [bacterium HR40]
MHDYSIDAWRHEHVFLGADHARHERRTWIVIGLTATMMVGEVAAGLAFGSMALLADGFHMATHAGALAITALAYLYARRHARDDTFTFGTGKLGELAGFSSAVILAVVALLVGVESVLRLAAPVAIRFDEAIAVAVLGLMVNLVSAWLLHEEAHHHGEDREPSHAHHHDDHNLRAAYFHVLTDALTSLLAIVALTTGRFYRWIWMDPLMGIAGSAIIAHWSWGLLRGAGAVLLDTVPDRRLRDGIQQILEANGDRIADLHLWRLGPGHMALVVSIVTARPQMPDIYKQKLARFRELSHITVEVHPCQPKREAA